MIGSSVDLAIDRITLEGVVLPADEVAAFPGLVEAELRRILDAGAAIASSGRDELAPLLLSEPVDAAALARALAERIAHRGLAEGAWDG